MPRILIVECMQEVSSFNPVPSEFESFTVERGERLYQQRGLNTGIGGALGVFDGRADVETVPSISAQAGSAGLLSATGWARLSTTVLEAVEASLEGVDAIYASLHGAMGAEGELDPEGYLLEQIRGLVGPHVPIVMSLDLHGILTERMLEHVDALAVYHTYPHVDFADTGARAARLLLHLLDGGPRPVYARVRIPALVRGDELITRTGYYGELIRECRRLEHEGRALSAAIMIGNPFTDVPELCTQVLIGSIGCADAAVHEAERLAGEFWAERRRMQSRLVCLERAIAQGRTMTGPVVFTDAADATSSGATGDSCFIVTALVQAGYEGRILAQVVDPGAAGAAHAAGVGATIEVSLGGALDPARFAPMAVSARVVSLSDGRARLETSGAALDAGPTAVLAFAGVTMVVLSRTLSLFDRAMYYANGLDPRHFDLIVVKSPHVEPHMYDAWVEANFNIDAPGATSADLRSLGHQICPRPMFPLDEDVQFTPVATLHPCRACNGLCHAEVEVSA